MKTMMKKSAFAALLFAAILSAASVAFASTFEECQAIISGLQAKTASVVLTGKSAETKDRPNLAEKLNNASLELNRAKFCDAILKLNDYKAKVNQLVSAGRINQDPAVGVTAQELLSDADAAITCINQLAAQGGVTCTF